MEHHELTLEFAIYATDEGEVTAAFCSCGKTWDWSTIKRIAHYFDRHVLTAMSRRPA